MAQLDSPVSIPLSSLQGTDRLFSDQKKVQASTQEQLVMLLLLVTIYPAWYFVTTSIDPGCRDSISERLIAVSPAAFPLALQLFVPGLGRYLAYFFTIGSISVMYHIFRLLVQNDFSMMMLSGAYVAYFTISIGFSRLSLLLVYVIAVLAGAVALSLGVRQEEALMFAVVIATLSVPLVIQFLTRDRVLRALMDSRTRLGHILDRLPLPTMVRGDGEIYTNRSFVDLFPSQGSECLRDVWSKLEAVTFDPKSGEKTHTLDTGLSEPLEVAVFGYSDSRVEMIMLRDETERIKAQTNMLHSSKMASLGEMAGGVAHEINNPLTIIIGFTELLLQKAKAPENLDREEVVRIGARILKVGRRIAEIVRGMRAFAKESEEEILQVKKISEVVQDTLSLCGEKLKLAGITLQGCALTSDVPVLCAQVSTSQILLNLFSNSLDALESQDDKQISLDVETVQSSGQVNLLVRDNGPGIPPEIRNKIMSPFFTTKDIGKGTGLGLAISKGLAEKQGGALLLRESSSGAHFVLTLKAPFAGV